ncbi:MAG: hypothetical protein ACJ8G3_05850 [Burkholderiaceae bacterium]
MDELEQLEEKTVIDGNIAEQFFCRKLDFYCIQEIKIGVDQRKIFNQEIKFISSLK